MTWKFHLLLGALSRILLCQTFYLYSIYIIHVYAFSRKIESACSGMCPCPTSCNCSDEYAPVCSTRGQNYTNACLAGCEWVPGPLLLVLTGIRLKNKQQQFLLIYVCKIPRIISIMNETGRLAATTLASLTVSYIFRADDVACNGTCPCQEPCACTRELSPVCGVNNITYPNQCVANCSWVHLSQQTVTC